jgi:uncharacterized protein YcnI
MSMRIAWLLVAGVAVLALPAAAEGHVSLHPNTLPAGSFPTITLRVPSEEPNASTSKVAVQFPPGFIGAQPAYLPGWKSDVVTSKLAQPVQTDEGTVSEQVKEIVWSGGKIPAEHFQDFAISTTIPEDDDGKALAFKTVQTYDNGKVSRWIGPADSEEPAPTVNVTAKGGVVQDVAGTEAGPGAANAAAQTGSAGGDEADDSDDSASKGLGIAALVVGIAALIAGLAALMMASRKSRRAAP